MPYSDPEKNRKCRQRYAATEKGRQTQRRASSRWARRNPEHMLWASAQARAKKLHLPFSIEIEDVVIPTHCPVLGISIISGQKRGTARAASPNSPSLDRIDNSKGYVPENVQVISWRANALKSDGTPEELLAIALYALRNKRKDK